MVEIKKGAIEQLGGPFAEGKVDKVSLFVVSKKNQKLKEMDLKNLTAEQRAAKLRKWAEDHRFVAVIEIGDTIFAHTHVKHAERLQGVEELSLDGKKVTVKALEDEDAERLAAVGEAFEEHVAEGIEEVPVEKEEKEEFEIESHRVSPPAREYLARKQLISDQVQMHFLMDLMVKNQLGKIIINSMRQYNEARRELQKQQEAEYQHAEIIRGEIKKGILRGELKKGEIQRKELQEEVVVDDAKRLGRTRGA